MDLYSKKQRTKIGLFILAMGITAFSLWYANLIVGKIRTEERNKVQLWSEAIQNRASLVSYTKVLFARLRQEEKKKVSHWLEATSFLAQADYDENIEFVSKIIQDNTTIPIIITDDKGKIIFYNNLDPEKEDDLAYRKEELQRMKSAYSPQEIQYYGDTKQYLYYRDSKIVRDLEETLNQLINSFISETVINSASVPVLYTNETQSEVVAFSNVDSAAFDTPEKLGDLIASMSSQNEPIMVNLGDETNYIFYEESFLLTQLRLYPYVMLIAIGLFLLVSYILFSTFRNSEQNQVWVGMAKETAHQLGTPLSSLLAWIEVLDSDPNVSAEIITEFKRDVSRLQTVTDRFSKIGSKPDLNFNNIPESLEDVTLYLTTRISRKVKLTYENHATDFKKYSINQPLFEWVVENICKNAVDAMEGEGTIEIISLEQNNQFVIDITDSGKGIPKSKHKTVFEPGFTTKKRGWGLGLSLCKRIIEQYHKGEIKVLKSEPGKGTTFRIVLNANT